MFVVFGRQIVSLCIVGKKALTSYDTNEYHAMYFG